MSPRSIHGLLAAVALLSATAVADEIAEPGAFQVFRSATIDHALFVLPDESAAGAASVDGWRLSATVEDGFRVYRAARGERVHTARVALSAAHQVAFNPAASRFERLARNLRVELRDPAALDRVVEAAGGTGGKAHPLLGFALVHLPAGADPVSAAAAVEGLPDVVSVRLTVRGPRREPR